MNSLNLQGIRAVSTYTISNRTERDCITWKSHAHTRHTMVIHLCLPSSSSPASTILTRVIDAQPRTTPNVLHLALYLARKEVIALNSWHQRKILYAAGILKKYDLLESWQSSFQAFAGYQKEAGISLYFESPYPWYILYISEITDLSESVLLEGLLTISPILKRDSSSIRHAKELQRKALKMRMFYIDEYMTSQVCNRCKQKELLNTKNQAGNTLKVCSIVPFATSSLAVMTTQQKTRETFHSYGSPW